MHSGFRFLATVTNPVKYCVPQFEGRIAVVSFDYCIRPDWREKLCAMLAKFLAISDRATGTGNVGVGIFVVSFWVLSSSLAGAAEIRNEAPSISPAQSAVSTNSPTEQFKAFISSPPVISNLVFQVTVPMEGGARPRDGSFARSTRFEYFQA